MGNVEATIKDAGTAANVPVEGIAVTSSPSNPTAGQVLRQALAIADGGGGSAAGSYAGVSNNAAQVMPWNVAATIGSITANSQGVVVTMPAACSAVQYAITGTWVGTVALQASFDNANWVSVADVASTSSYTANKTSVVLTAPYQYFRVESTAWTSGTASISLQPVSNVGGASAGVTQPVSAASLPLPSGASTSAKQPALGTAGSASADVISVQGIASMTALKVDGSGVTQPISIATMPALVASAANIGNVGGKTAKVAVTPTLTASSAYVAGNEVGGLMTFSSALLTAGSGVLESISVRCKSVQTTALLFALFDTNPTNSTWTNKSAPAINASDIPFLVGIYSLSVTYSSLGTHTIWNLNGIGQALNAGATTLYGVLVCSGTPTFAATSDITVVLGILQD